MVKRQPQFIFHGLRCIQRRLIIAAAPVFFVIGGLITFSQAVSSQPSIFRVGEKLTYHVSFGKFADGGYAELYVVSRGKLGGKDAVEIRSKAKTFGLVSAAFVLLDESRTVYAAPDTGLPIYIRRSINDGPLPKETISNFLDHPTSNFDLLTLIYKAREVGGTGTFPFAEGEQIYTATFQNTVTERVKTDAGDFDTSVSVVQSEFLAANGIKDLRINFTTDEAHVPVLIRCKNVKGEFNARLSAIHLAEPEAASTPAPTPVPTPVTPATPRPTPTPELYVENRPLSTELGFELGETLAYNISSGGKAVAVMTLEARERKQFEKKDSLLLTATITGTEPENKTFALGDAVKAQVDPETLTPRWFEGKFSSTLSGLNQTVTFDQKTGNISFGGAAPVDSPIGTHSLLSLVYAMRSFNLKLSKDPNNPVNDTRVAVFWASQPYVFTLRPSNPADITINGGRVSAQLITVNTGNPQLDTLGLKVWLGTNSRVPLRFSVGTFQADLISQSTSIPQ